MISGLVIPQTQLSMLIPAERPDLVALCEAHSVPGPTPDIKHGRFTVVLSTRRKKKFIYSALGGYNLDFYLQNSVN